MSKKVRIGVMAASILSGGVILVTGINHYNISKVEDLAKAIGTIELDHASFNGNDYLNDIYSKFVSTISEHDSIKEKYKLKEISIDDLNYVPSLSADDFCYTFFKGCTRINLLDDGRCYATCNYYDDGHYSISCSYKNEIENILDSIDKNNDQDFDYWFRYRDKFGSITYNFNTDGVLTDSNVSGPNYRSGKFVYKNDDINEYDFSIDVDGVFLTKDYNSYIVHDTNTSLNLDFFSKYNDIADAFYDKNPESAYIFSNSYFYDVQYKFDKDYKFDSIEATNDYDEYLKIDNSKNLEYKNFKMTSPDKSFYDHVYSDNNTFRIVSDDYLDGDRVTYDSTYNKNGDLISKKCDNKLIYSYNDGKEYYYDNGIIDHVIENKDGEILTHYYENGEIVRSLGDNYSIKYDKGQICSVNVDGDRKLSLDINGITYELDNGDFVSFENGILTERRISNEEWAYYPNGLIRTYKNDVSNIYICYDKNGNISRCSFNYLNDYYKKAFDPKENFNYIMNNIDSNYRLDCDLNGDFIVEFKDDISIVKNDKIEFSFNGDRLYNLFYRSFNGDTQFEFYNVNILNQKNGDEVHNVIIYDGKFYDGRTFNYSTDEGIVHEGNVSNKTK